MNFFRGLGLNKFDAITAVIGLVGVVLSIVGVATGAKANDIRMEQQAEAWKKIAPPAPPMAA